LAIRKTLTDTDSYSREKAQETQKIKYSWAFCAFLWQLSFFDIVLFVPLRG
jgi:hypothetical protein